jgi:hypothetical protein
MFAEMPLDNRTVDKFAARAAIQAFSLLSLSAANDLIFRHR